MIRLALIGDLHYFLEGDSELISARDRFYEGYLKKFFEIEADLHVSLGDLTHQGIAAEYENVYRYIHDSGVSFRHVLGNHDAYVLTKTEIQSMIDHPLYYVIDTKDALLVFLDSTREMRPDDWSGDLDAEQLEWLETQLQTSPSKPVLVFAHHPVIGTTTMSKEDKMYIDPVIDMRSILGKRKGSGFYFNGHNHIHSIVQEGQWHFIQTAASMCHPSVRIVEIDENQVRTKILTIDDKDLLESAKILYDKLSGYHNPPNAMGEHSDRERVIQLQNLAIQN